MDSRARDNTWFSQLNTTFNDTEMSGPMDDPTTQDNVTKCKSLLKKRTHIWWNHAFLSKYIEKNRIPRGLNVQIFPSFPTLEESFKSKWESYADICSMGFMSLLKDTNQKTLDELEVEIETIQVSLIKELNSDALKKLNEDIDIEFQKRAKDIQTNKIRKFQRDLREKQTNTAYRWKNATDRSRFRSSPYSRSRSTSAISSSSADEPTVSSQKTTDNGGLSAQSISRVQTRPSNRRNPLTNQVSGTQGGLLIVNLSSHVLTAAQVEVLSTALSFSPTNSFDYFTALFTFCQKFTKTPSTQQDVRSCLVLTDCENKFANTLTIT
ncbi:uncharacterized protein [Phyllobates terribilis]